MPRPSHDWQHAKHAGRRASDFYFCRSCGRTKRHWEPDPGPCLTRPEQEARVARGRVRQVLGPVALGPARMRQLDTILDDLARRAAQGAKADERVGR